MSYFRPPQLARLFCRGADSWDGAFELLADNLSRTSSQKPGDDLLANFRQQFPEVAAATSTSAAVPATTATASSTLSGVVTTSQQERYVVVQSPNIAYPLVPGPVSPGSLRWPPQGLFAVMTAWHIPTDTHLPQSPNHRARGLSRPGPHSPRDRTMEVHTVAPGPVLLLFRLQQSCSGILHANTRRHKHHLSSPGRRLAHANPRPGNGTGDTAVHAHLGRSDARG